MNRPVGSGAVGAALKYVHGNPESCRKAWGMGQRLDERSSLLQRSQRILAIRDTQEGNCVGRSWRGRNRRGSVAGALRGNGVIRGSGDRRPSSVTEPAWSVLISGAAGQRLVGIQALGDDIYQGLHAQSFVGEEVDSGVGSFLGENAGSVIGEHDQRDRRQARF
jgi:hypothetical protein